MPVVSATSSGAMTTTPTIPDFKEVPIMYKGAVPSYVEKVRFNAFYLAFAV